MSETPWLEVVKLNVEGKETYRYGGHVLWQDDHSITLKAFFDREYLDIHGLIVRKGDCFIETYYADRWFNIYEIHSQNDNVLLGWYCNIATPANFFDDRIEFRDLALDLLVFPDGKQLVLDEAEFNQLPITPEMRAHALEGLAELRQLFIKKS